MSSLYLKSIFLHLLSLETSKAVYKVPHFPTQHMFLIGKYKGPKKYSVRKKLGGGLNYKSNHV